MFPARIATKMTLGGVLLLGVTIAIVCLVLLLRGQPRIIEASNKLIEQAGGNLVSKLDQQLAGIQGEAVSMARLAEVLPHDVSLWQNSFPQMIDSNGNHTIAGGGIWPEPEAYVAGTARRSFSGRVKRAANWLTPTDITSPRPAITTRKAGIPRHAMRHAIAVPGLMFIRIRFQASKW